MRFIARTPIKYTEGEGRNAVVKVIQVGRSVPANLVDEDLLACRAIEEIEDGEEPGPTLSDEPLNKQSKAELLATADSELVTVADGATNAEIVAAIEAKRSERAGGQA